MSEAKRGRDPAAEESERLSFVILQHVYSLDTGEEPDVRDGAGSLLVGRIAAALAIPPSRVVQIVAHLTYTEFLCWAGTGRPVRITPKGTEYIERLAHRRRSLRVVTGEAGVR